jgi:FAD:protein FMN transferase
VSGTQTAAPPVTFPALGTTAVLILGDEQATAEAQQIFQEEIDAMDRVASRFRDDSELSRLQDCVGRPRRVSERLAEVLAVGLRGAELTGGRVDPTVGSALGSLGYDRDFEGLDPDGPPVRFTVRPVPGWTSVRLDPLSRVVRVPAGVVLDFGATAKALCADRSARAIYRETGAAVLVGLGGDISVAGPPPEDGWRVHVADRYDHPEDTPAQTVVIRVGGLATSGTSTRRWTRAGRVLHHLIDPLTGQPAHEVWRTASVAAGSCVDANIASTAAMLLGEKAPGWLEERSLPARLVTRKGLVVTVAGWPGEEAGP